MEVYIVDPESHATRYSDRRPSSTPHPPNNTILWGFLDVRKAAMYIGITEICMFIISSLLFAFGHKHHLGTVSETNAIVNLCLSGTLVVMVAIMFLGLKRENGNYLIPHLAWQIVTIIGLVVGLLFTFLYQDADSDVAILVTVVVVVITRLCLQVYFFTVVFRCCMFFYDKPKNFHENRSSARAAGNKEVSDEEFWNYHPATEFY